MNLGPTRFLVRFSSSYWIAGTRPRSDTSRTNEEAGRLFSELIKKLFLFCILLIDKPTDDGCPALIHIFLIRHRKAS